MAVPPRPVLTARSREVRAAKTASLKVRPISQPEKVLRIMRLADLCTGGSYRRQCSRQGLTAYRRGLFWDTSFRHRCAQRANPDVDG